MINTGIYNDIASRTGGDVYIGVVGPVRTGKSTLIHKIMQALVIPSINNADEKARATDQMPQSGSGKTVMTTEPKFVPDTAVSVNLDGNVRMNVKMIDCVGYMVDDAVGVDEEGKARMVKTPWSDEEMPFEKAAELGTKKVITEHSTIAIAVTTDGTVTDIGRAAYVKAEEMIIDELKKSQKPFVIVLNSADPDSDAALSLAYELEDKYKTPVALINCEEISKEDVEHILELVLLEFPVSEIDVNMPTWFYELDKDNELRNGVFDILDDKVKKIRKISDIADIMNEISDDRISSVKIESTDLSCGKSDIRVKFKDDVFYKVLSEASGLDINGDEDLLSVMNDFGMTKRKYDKIAAAFDEAEKTGYGIVTPDVTDLKLEEPEIVKKQSGYGVKLKASADSIHLIKTKITSEVNPIVGSEKQSEEMVKYLLEEFDENPASIWDSNMFGKSLYELAGEGLNAKLEHMPADARAKLGGTLEKIVEEGSNGLICILL